MTVTPPPNGDPAGILATSPPIDDRTQVLKHGNTFAVLNRFGDIRQAGLGEEGVFHYGSRVLSRLILRFADRPMLLLGTTIHEDHAVLSVDLTNPDLTEDGQVVLPKDAIHIHRMTMVYRDALVLRLVVHNYHQAALEWPLSLNYAADYADIFEVRGVRRERRGILHDPLLVDDRIDLRYTGLDGVDRHTRLRFVPAPTNVDEYSARFELRLAPGDEKTIDIVASFNSDDANLEGSFSGRLQASRSERLVHRANDAIVRASNEHFDSWLERSAADLHLLTTDTSWGPYPYAGIPWFSTPFGRDGLIAALMYLWVNPQLAHGVLWYLAEMQADELNTNCDAQPGKILHEARYGEMAALNEIPFHRYYGTIDATPLFVILAGAYYQRTADHHTLVGLWPHVERALDWMDHYGDRDEDGFLEYVQQAERGIYHQGWKDSNDAIFHADGRSAEPPIALCEVQAYAFAARRAAAEMAAVLGETSRAEKLLLQAAQLKKRFEAAFWLKDLGLYALALDRDKQPCRVRSSNAGQCLFSGIVSRQRARRVAQEMLSPRFFSGWGVRTIAAGEPRYNPMSYHNGSIWPHDNALIAYGLARYNLKDEAVRILESMFDLSRFLDLNRMPELLCGFSRHNQAGPTLYPVACSPQAWAAGAVFLLVQATLGLTIDAPNRELRFMNPRMPANVKHLTIEQLQVGESMIDLKIERHRQDVGVSVLNRGGERLNVVIRK